MPKQEQMLGKVPPQAVDLEEAVLGAIMLEKGAIGKVEDVLTQESFYKDDHSKIFEAIQELNQKSEPIDILTVTHKLRELGTLESCGGPYAVTQLTDKVSSAANLEYHSRIIQEHAMKRQVIALSNEVANSAYEDGQDVFELLDRLGEGLSALMNSTSNKEPRVAKAVLSELFEDIQRRNNQSGEVTGVPSSIQAVDSVTSGWQASDLIIIAARPAMGKTAFALTAAKNASIMHGVPTLIFSLEMSAMQLIGRLASSESRVNGEKVQRGKLLDYEFTSVVNHTGKLAKAPLWIDDTPGITPLELRAKARRLKQKHGIQLIVVDYLQLMSGDRKNKYGPNNREQEISTISRSLKHLAKELNVPVIALSQLSRAVESRGGDKRPQLSDLRESGSIEQDADMVGFLYRPEYYGYKEDELGNSLKGYAELLIKKHRNGSLGSVDMLFEGWITKFSDWQGLDSSAQFPVN
ncbi:replicative DNA helicase [Roseivirga pacifica]|uniref:replicative DNA helicase n=1 Tax=Roseivirga pacifica TaxID=1267423 RepID=UPI002096354F|nr:replicative DNA helicase [Roseivirga pacifica]MCO6358193.1 replicative DNA helicase [Roseivirga pacifica]MCO6366631.1 replicative DNA helicase [Roseivirga pacifica]MCO6371116.1 replicative DNA helicase [Roseivirga pacifica]MCO6373924.1 replicative DNA helicase [Roseivirga pacifica]MCO6380905.1 replicative DNA helicase [Roseivirga pacifica]